MNAFNVDLPWCSWDFASLNADRVNSLVDLIEWYEGLELSCKKRKLELICLTNIISFYFFYIA